MSRISGLTRRLRRYLSDRLERLNAALSDLAGRLRATVAARLADNVAGVVQEAVEAALAEPTQRPPPQRTFGYHTPTWAERAAAMPSDPLPQEDLFGNDALEPLPPQEEDQWESMPSVPAPPVPPRWQGALATGLQASAWWLRRRRGQASLLAALAITVAAGAVAWGGGRLVAAGAATLGSLLALTG